MNYTMLTLIGKDKSKQVIKLSDKFGTEMRRGILVKTSSVEQERIAKDIGHDIL